MLPECKFQGESAGSSGQTGWLGPDNDALSCLVQEELTFYLVGDTLYGNGQENRFRGGETRLGR